MDLKTIYSRVFTHHIWFWLVLYTCSPVTAVIFRRSSGWCWVVPELRSLPSKADYTRVVNRVVLVPLMHVNEREYANSSSESCPPPTTGLYGYPLFDAQRVAWLKQRKSALLTSGWICLNNLWRSFWADCKAPRRPHLRIESFFVQSTHSALSAEETEY